MKNDWCREFLSPGAGAEINIDGKTMEETKLAMKNPSRWEIVTLVTGCTSLNMLDIPFNSIHFPVTCCTFLNIVYFLHQVTTPSQILQFPST